GLTSKGKVLYFGWLAAAPERLLLVLPASRCEAVLAHLSRYAVFQKVSLADATAQFRLTALYGPSALAVTLSDAVTRLAADGEMAGSALSAMPGHGEVLRALVEAGSVALGDASAEILRVEAGRPLFGTDADETNLPDEIGLESAISRTKGCFVGQEIVARLRTYGSVSRRLVGFRFPGGALAPGTVFADPDKPGHALGRITSAAMSPRFGPIGLGFAARDVPDGATLAGDGGATAIVGPLPFA
ncbi:MAG TPA: hypothetical protein VGG65_07785, partial [Thermoanaerobaculia bacterium]